jgi:transcription-repair coupling factor (superfamily II helicase)
MGRSFAPERQAEVNVFDALAAHVKTRLKTGPVVIASHSDGARERLSGLLDDHGAAGRCPVTTMRDVAGKGCT